METVTKRELRTGKRALWIVVPVVILSLAPLVWALFSSVRPGSEIFAHLYPVTSSTIIPDTWTLDNYINLLTGPFAKALLNTVIVVVVSVSVGVVVASLAAYALAVIDFPGRTIVFSVMVVSFLIPFEAIAIPLSVTFRDWGLANTYVGLILPAIGNGLAIFNLRQFFLNVPPSLAEAARLDGLGYFGIYRRMYMPLSKGALVGSALIFFVFQWQSFLWPLLNSPAPSMRVATVAIADFAQEAGVDYGQMFAAAILTAAIPLVLLLIFQRQFTGSMATEGSKE